MKTRKWIPLLLLAAVLLCMPLTAEAAKVKLNKTKVTQICNDATTVLELKNAADGNVVWKSSNKKVATCEAGGSHCIIHSHKAGKAKITAKYKGRKYTCKVTVKEKPQITPRKLSIHTDVLTPDNYIMVFGTAKKVTWSVSDRKILSLVRKYGNDCFVNGLKPGTAKVIAKVGKKKLTCTVTVTDRKLTAMEAAYTKVLISAKPSAFKVIDFDGDKTPELVTADITDSAVTLKLYCYTGGATQAAGRIAFNPGEWEEYSIVYDNNGMISLSGTKPGQYLPPCMYYRLKDKKLSEYLYYDCPDAEGPEVMRLNGTQINLDDEATLTAFWNAYDSVSGNVLLSPDYTSLQTLDSYDEAALTAYWNSHYEWNSWKS